MTLRGSGTEFHDTTISVNDVEQKTFGQDTDSAYDVNNAVNRTETTKLDFTANPNGITGGFGNSIEWSFTIPFTVTETVVSLDITTKQIDNTADFDYELDIGGTQVDSINVDGFIDTRTDTLSGTGTDTTVTFRINRLFDCRIANINGTVEFTQSVAFDPPVDSVIKTE